MRLVDQIQRSISIEYPPKRIISTVPSLTEYLHYLDLEKEVCGISKFCIKPEKWYRQKTRIGGTKSLDLEKIRELNPDLIIANKEENEQEQIEALAAEFPVYVTDIKNLETCYSALLNLAELCQRKQRGIDLVNRLKAGFKALEIPERKKSCLYFIWQKPDMLAGKDTFISSLLKEIGFINLAESLEGRYPSIENGSWNFDSPDFIFLSSEPFPFGEMHVMRFQKLFPKAEIKLIDGEAFSWYGSRLLESISYFQQFTNSLTAECR